MSIRSSEHKIKYCAHCDYIIAQNLSACSKCGQPLTLQEITIFIGKIFSKYKIIDIIGAGGMGIVFKGQHELLDNFSAIKMILPSEIDETTLKRFMREARTLAHLKHPNIVDVFDADYNEYGFPYYVMEYLEGISLRDLLQNQAGPLPPETIFTIMNQFLSGLAFAHQNGIIHRDLKPENIFLARKGDIEIIKILDFGIAKGFVKGTPDASTLGTLTAAGTLMGTPHYMSPEQLLDEEITFSSDVFSSGLILYEMLTGSQAVSGKTLSEVFKCHFNDETARKIEEMSNVSESMKAFLKLCVSREQHRRFKNAAEMKNAFSPAQAPDTAVSFAQTISVSVDQQALETMDAHISKTPSAISVTTATASEKTPAANISIIQFSPSAKRFVIFLALFIFIIAIGITLYFWRSSTNKQPGSSAGKSIPAAAPPIILKKINLIEKIPVPAEVDELLQELYTQDYDYWLLKSEKKLYVYDFKAKFPVQTIPCLANKIFLGTTLVKNDYAFLWLANDAITITDINQTEQKKISIGSGNWSGGQYDDFTKYLFLYDDTKLQTLSMDNNHLKKLCQYELKEAPIIADHNNSYLAIRGKGFIEILGITDCTFRKKLDIGEMQIFAAKLHLSETWVAYGGWFQKVTIYDFKNSKTVFETDLPGQTLSFEFFYDAPTLLVLKSQALYACTILQNKCEKAMDSQGSFFSKLSYQPTTGSLYLLTKSPTEVHRITYTSSQTAIAYQIAKESIWTLTAYPPHYYIVGTSNNVLYIFDTVTKKTQEWQNLHAQGITRIIAINNLLLSASDDKTLKLSNPLTKTVIKEIKAHEGLVNYIFTLKENNIFYTVSSDGSFKKWTLPDLTLVESATGYPSLATIWVSPDETRALLGTWDSQMIFVEKKNNKWITSWKTSIEARGIYNQCVIPDAHLIFLVGSGSFQHYLFDLDTNTLHQFAPIPFFSDSCQTIDNSTIALGSTGKAAKISFHREARSISYEASFFYDLQYPVFGAAAFNSTNNSPVFGTDNGWLIELPLTAFPQSPIIRGNIKW